MSFTGYKSKIEDGDTVVLFFGYDCMLQLRVKRNETHQTRYGALRHSDLIGKKFGSKVTCSKGWVYVLHPTPELWTLTLPHRTQILYTTDISMVLLQLDMKPGSVIVESGTGSGSLSHAIARTILPDGHLYTFDFHEQRVEKAREEFRQHGLEKNVTVAHRDVCNTGFDLENIADAVFLDLPAPWNAIPYAKKAMSEKGGRLCSFSPCIEQVQRACDAMTDNRFTDIHTVECLSRTFDTRTIIMPLPDLGYGPGKWSDTDGTEQVYDPSLGHVEVDVKPQPDANEDNDDAEEEVVEKNKQGGHKRKKNSRVTQQKGSKRPQGSNLKSPSFIYKSGLAPMTMPGHTGYLTFATLYPKSFAESDAGSKTEESVASTSESTGKDSEQAASNLLVSSTPAVPSSTAANL